MKILIALVFAFLPWYPIGWAIHQVTGESELAVVGTTVISVFIFYYLAKRITGTDSLGSFLSHFKSMSGLDFDDRSSAFYAQAEEECENGEVDKGLWSHALVTANGDEGQRKVEYMKLRVKELQKISNKSRKADA